MATMNYYFWLIACIFFINLPATAQTVNFEETWKEFLDNNKVVNMSQLNKPNKKYDALNYIKYLLMNTNSSFCQSEVEEAEDLVAEIYRFDSRAHQDVPGFVPKLKDLEAKIAAYHQVDKIWMQFLDTKEVDLEVLESIEAIKTLCEKSTLAKYSYMTAYTNFCKGNVDRAKNIIENRTLRLTEKTSLRVEDVKGLKPELAKMKVLFQNLPRLQSNWDEFVQTGTSPGFDTELPLFPCYPVPNIKEWTLKGAANVCEVAPTMLEKIKKVQTESGVALEQDLRKKIKELEMAVDENKNNLLVLNKTWEAFLPDNEVPKNRQYGYEYCSQEPLIRAYIMDGFANVCGNAEEMLQKIDAIQQTATVRLDKVTTNKINELTMIYLENDGNGDEINLLWEEFVAMGDTIYGDYQFAEYYCDHIYDVKSWVIRGLNGTCKEGSEYLELIEAVKSKLEFDFTKDIRCRVQKLRIKVWDCRYEALKKLANAQASTDPLEERIQKLMQEYGMKPRPAVCVE